MGRLSVYTSLYAVSVVAVFCLLRTVEIDNFALWTEKTNLLLLQREIDAGRAESDAAAQARANLELAVNTLANYDPEVVPLLDAPVGGDDFRHEIGRQVVEELADAFFVE